MPDSEPILSSSSASTSAHPTALPSSPASPPLSAHPAALTIGDLIEVPPVQTVVHLSDLTHADKRSTLAESFVLTDEVRGHLKRLLSALTAGHGMGAFLRGHYGSGKSHFLVFLQLLVSGQVDTSALATLEPELAPLLELLSAQSFQVASVSLVEHSAQEPLESIVTQALESLTGPTPLPFPDEAELTAHLDTLRYHLRKHHSDTLFLFLQDHDLTEVELFVPAHLGLIDQLAREVRFPFRPEPGRSARFEHLFSSLRASKLAGVVLLVDELSEFLHSKTGSALTEDVRFLQFLGETSTDEPLFIVAALQEYLEASEYGLPGELVRKIKDRYPNNLELTTTHIEEIISRRLIHHRPGSEEAIAEIHRDLRSYLQGFPVPLARFSRAYPIHPATILLLDRLKPLLSRSRGVVDFIHYRISGSAERGMKGLLDAPADHLLTPDAIFDHFEVRIRENVEISTYDTVVYEYYKRVLQVLFPDPDVRDLALRLVKMLILLAISPEPRPYSVRTLTHALLVRVSRIDPEANFLHVRDILDKLVAEGAYLERIPHVPDERGRDHSRDQSGFDDVYRLSLKADLNLVMARRIQSAVSSLAHSSDLRIFEALAPSLSLESLPLNRFVGQGSQIFTVQWQRTPREGRVTVGPLTQLDVPRMVDTLAELADTERDWALFVGVPYDVEAQRNHLSDVLLPALRRASETVGRTVLFWIPDPISFEGPHGDFLRETLARRAVLTREREEGGTSQAQGMIDLLEKALESDKARIEQVFHQAYYQGRILSVAGEEENISNLGRPLFDQTLLAVLTPVLAARYSEHAACAPLGRMPTLDDVEAIVDRLYRAGAYQPRGGDADPLASRMVSLLRPLGLVKKTGATLTLSVDVTRPGAAKAFAAQLQDKPQPLKEIALAMRKGPLGIGLPMFQLLTLGLAYTGAIVCFTNHRRREAGQLSGLNFDQIQEVSRGELAQLDLSALAHLPFLPDNAIPRGELTFARQEQLWLALKDARDKLNAMLRRVREGLSASLNYRALSSLDRTALERDLERFDPLVDAIKPALGVREGIERTLEALTHAAPMKLLADRLDSAATFFQVGLDRFLMIHRYMDRVGALPEGLDYAELRDRRQEVESRLRNDELLFNPLGMELLEAAFRRFQEDYAAIYRVEHDQWRGPARFAPFEALRASDGYRLLGRLTRIGSLAVDDRKGILDRRLTEALVGRCQRLGAEDLLAAARCACGFALGDTVPLLPIEELRTLLAEGLRSSLDALGASRHREALKANARDLDQVGRQEDAARMRTLVEMLEADVGEMPDGDQAMHGLDSLLTERLSREVDQALRGVSMVEERDLDQLIAQLQERCLPRDEVERLFSAWLGQRAASAGAFYRMVRRGEADIGASSGLNPALEALLQRRFSRLREPARLLGEERLLLGAFLAEWMVRHGISSAAREVLFVRWRRETPVSEDQIDLLAELAGALRGGPRDRLEAALVTAESALLREGLASAVLETLELPGASMGALTALFEREETFPTVLAGTAGELAAQIEQSDAPQLADTLASAGDLPGPVATPRQELGQALIDLSWIERHVHDGMHDWPATAEGWERLNEAQLADLPVTFYRWLGAATRWGLMDEAGAVERRRRFLASLGPTDAAFSAFYRTLAAHPEGIDHWLNLQTEVVQKHARALGDPEPLWIVLDGFRWDLWRSLKPLVSRFSGGLIRVMHEETGWVRPTALPEPTPMALLEPTPAAAFGLEAQRGLFDRIAGAGRSDASVIRLPVILDRLRRSDEPLPALYAELISSINGVLRPTLEALPLGRVAILTGETGFEERIDPTGGLDAAQGSIPFQARYDAGSVSPWGILVPMIVLHKPTRSRPVL